MSKPLIAITGASSATGKASARAFSAAVFPLPLMARHTDFRVEEVLIQELLITPKRQEY